METKEFIFYKRVEELKEEAFEKLEESNQKIILSAIFQERHEILHRIFDNNIALTDKQIHTILDIPIHAIDIMRKEFAGQLNQ